MPYQPFSLISLKSDLWKVIAIVRGWLIWKSISMNMNIWTRVKIMLSFSLYDKTLLPYISVSANKQWMTNREAGILSDSQSQASYCDRARDRCQGGQVGWSLSANQSPAFPDSGQSQAETESREPAPPTFLASPPWEQSQRTLHINKNVGLKWQWFSWF